MKSYRKQTLGFAVKPRNQAIVVGGVLIATWLLFRNMGFGGGSGTSIFSNGGGRFLPEPDWFGTPYVPPGGLCQGTLRLVGSPANYGSTPTWPPNQIYFDDAFIMNSGGSAGFNESLIKSNLQFLSSCRGQLIKMYSQDNTVYAGTQAPVFDALRDMGIIVVEVDAAGNRI